MGYGQNWKTVRDYMLQHIGEAKSVYEIASTLELSDTQVAVSMRTLIRHGHDLDVLINNRLWVMRSAGLNVPLGPGLKTTATDSPEDEPETRTFKLLGRPHKGRYVALDLNDNSVWWVQPIED